MVNIEVLVVHLNSGNIFNLKTIVVELVIWFHLGRQSAIANAKKI